MFKHAMTAAAAAAMTLSLAGAAAAEQTRERSQRATIQTERGQAAAERRVTRSKGFREVNRSVTGAEGRTRSLDTVQTRGVDEDGARFRTNDRARTFADGTTTTRSAERTWNPETGEGGKDVERVFRDGSVRTVDTDVNRVDEGVFNVDRTVVGRDGDVRSQTGVVEIERSGDAD